MAAMVTQGMNPALVRQAADEMDRTASSLHALAGSINGTVGRMSAGWVGADVDQLVHQWQRVSRPAVEALATVVHDLATRARHQAHDQDVASGVAGSAGGVGTSPRRVSAFTNDRPADAHALKVALTNAHSRERVDAGRFPGAVAQLKALESQLSDPPTASQVEALNRYATLIKIASMQESTVADAANLAVDSFKDATKSDMAAVSSAFGVKNVEPASILHGAGHALADGTDAKVSDVVQSKVLDGITHGNAASIVSAYDHSADQYLRGIGRQISGVSALNHVDYGNAFQSATILDGRLAEQNYNSIAGDVSQMVTGDGSLAQNVMVAVPSQIPGVAPIWNGAQALANGWHGGHAAMVGVGALKVANVDSLGTLASAGYALGLDK